MIWWPCQSLETRDGAVIFNPAQQSVVEQTVTLSGPWAEETVTTDLLGITDD